MTLTQKSKCIADEAVINILTLSMVLGNQKRSDAPCSKNTFGCMKVQSDSDKTVEPHNLLASLVLCRIIAAGTMQKSIIPMQ